MKHRSVIDGLHFDTPAMRATQCERHFSFSRSSRVGAQRRIEGGKE
jgi:hypothetical protein